MFSLGGRITDAGDRLRAVDLDSASKIKRNLERCYSKLKEIFFENF